MSPPRETVEIEPKRLGNVLGYVSTKRIERFFAAFFSGFLLLETRRYQGKKRHRERGCVTKQGILGPTRASKTETMKVNSNLAASLPWFSPARPPERERGAATQGHELANLIPTILKF